MSECWTFNVALLNLNLRRVHLRAVHAARARALPPGAQVEARKSQDCMMPEALLDPIVRAPALAPNTPACAHETHELRHRSVLRDRQGAGTLCASASRPRWRALRPPRLHGPHAVMNRCEGRRRLRQWIGWGAACSFMTSSINVSPSSRARARAPMERRDSRGAGKLKIVLALKMHSELCAPKRHKFQSSIYCCVRERHSWCSMSRRSRRCLDARRRCGSRWRVWLPPPSPTKHGA